MNDFERRLRDLGEEVREDVPAGLFPRREALRRIGLRRRLAAATAFLSVAVVITGGVVVATEQRDDRVRRKLAATPEPDATLKPGACVPDFVATYLPRGFAPDSQPGSGGGVDQPGHLEHYRGPVGRFIDVTSRERGGFVQTRRSRIFVLGERATIGAIHEGYSVEFEVGGCRYALLGYGVTRSALERFAVGLRFEDDDLGFSAIWPEDTLDAARLDCYADRDRRWPGRVAEAFVRNVLGWEGFGVSTLSGGNPRRFTIDAPTAAEPRGEPDVRVYVEEVLPRCWSVSSVSPVHARRVDDSGISVSGRNVDLAFDPAGATTVTIEVGYGDDVHTVTWEGGETVVHLELREPPESTGHFLVLRRDVRGVVFSASGGPLPPGDFTAG